MRNLDRIRKCVNNCKRCGSEFGNSACGFGRHSKPEIFFVGLNPWVENHEFKDGRGITILKRNLKEWEFNSFFFDNIVKCQMPWNGNPKKEQIRNCLPYLDEQIKVVNSKIIVIFGQLACEACGFRYKAWSDGSFLGKPLLTVPHFSSILYNSSKKKIENYYKKLKGFLEL